MQKYKTVIFDLDGTLLNTLEDLADGVNAALEKFSLPVRTIDEVRHFVGNGIRNLIKLSVPEHMDGAVTEKVFEYFSEYYTSHCRIKTAPYDGITELLTQLKRAGYKIAVVSNKADKAVKILCADFFGETVDVAIGENEKAGVLKKPAPDSVFAAMKALGAKPGETVYVGDSEVDVKTAENSNIPCVSVCWGFRSEEEIRDAGAVLICHNISELKDAL